MSELIWKNSVDQGKWLVEVNELPGTDGYGGILTVTEGATGEVVHRERVSVSYRAVFGPDLGDVAEWQDRAIEAIDNPKSRTV